MFLWWPVTARFSLMSMSEKARVLILGGTTEAVALARALDERAGPELEIVSSLAGRTRSPVKVPGEVRTGGFGGAAALADYLSREGFAAVIDATHPFADRISANAFRAAMQAGVPLLRVERPPWAPVEGDEWHMVPSVTEAAGILPRFGSRVFLTVGQGELSSFAVCEGVWFLVRLVDRPAGPVPLPSCEVVAARGPFNLENELALFRRHEIDALVCKASGGEMTYAKLAAARQLNLPVVMVERPAAPAGKAVESVDLAVNWLLDLQARDTGAA